VYKRQIEQRSLSLVSLTSLMPEVSDMPPRQIRSLNASTAAASGLMRKSQSLSVMGPSVTVSSCVPSFAEYMNPIDDMEEDDIGLAI